MAKKANKSQIPHIFSAGGLKIKIGPMFKWLVNPKSNRFTVKISVKFQASTVDGWVKPTLHERNPLGFPTLGLKITKSVDWFMNGAC